MLIRIRIAADRETLLGAPTVAVVDWNLLPRVGDMRRIPPDVRCCEVVHVQHNVAYGSEGSCGAVIFVVREHQPSGGGTLLPERILNRCPRSDSMKQTVLFIDDEQYLLDGIRRAMRNEAFRVVCVDSPDAARATMAAERVDLVVCDEHMPGMSGSEFLSELHQLHPATMRMMLSGNTTLGAVLQAINAGQVFRILLKPCSHGDLVDNITQALAQKLLMDRCRKVLHLFKRQNDMLQTLERQHPGLLEHLGDDPQISYAAADAASPESLIGEMAVEIERASGMHDAVRPDGKGANDTVDVS